MTREAYNYKEALDHPIEIQELNDYIRLPFPVRLARIVIIAIIGLIMFIFRNFINAIGSAIPGLSILLYLGVPYLVSGWLLRLNVDGKKLHFFLYDYFLYLFRIKIPKKKIANDSEVLYLNEKEVKFE